MSIDVDVDVRADLTNAYTNQVRADLEGVDAEIAQVEARLKSLQADRVLLGKLWENLSGVSAETAAPVRSRRAPAANGNRSPKRPASAGGTRKSRPTERGSVRDAVLRCLRKSDGPVSVNDMFDALPSTVQASGKVVVRNTLEALVAKGVAERSRQGQSVRYAFVDHPAEDAEA
jgi:hypothetical protein